ncbi:MAG: hypothetical protein WCC74_00600 [Minisyncoccia bacterium]
MDFEEIKQEAKEIFENQKTIYCPFFQTNVNLISDGFNHLQYKGNRMPRNIDEQRLKLTLLSKALQVIKSAGTLQEYRRGIEKIGKKGNDGFFKTKDVEYWAFHAILGKDYLRKIVVILKRIGDGQIIFWGVMPHKKFNNQKLYEDGIEDF